MKLERSVFFKNNNNKKGYKEREQPDLRVKKTIFFSHIEIPRIGLWTEKSEGECLSLSNIRLDSLDVAIRHYITIVHKVKSILYLKRQKS